MKPLGGGLYSWLWLIGMILIGLGVSVAALVSEGIREKLGTDWGTLLLLAGAGVLLVAVNETSTEARTQLVELSLSIAGIFGFVGVFINLSFENPLVLVLLGGLFAYYFLIAVPIVYVIRRGLRPFFRWWRRRFAQRPREDVLCFWCHDPAMPNEGLCKSCWNWVHTGKRH